MSRRPNAEPSVRLELKLPLPLHAKMTAYLGGTAESQPPYGAYRNFFIEVLEEYFSVRHIDLAPYVGCAPNTVFINGNAAAIDLLKTVIKERENG